MASRARQFALRLLVPVITVVICLFVVELLLRLPMFEGYKDYEPTLKGGPLAYLPNQDTRHRLGSDFDTLIHINSRGFRDSEYAGAGRTALALGDSFTEGWGVDLEESWPKRLHEELARRGNGYEHIYDAGRSGTNPKNYAAVFDQFFSADPHIDLVIVGLCLSNDIIDVGTPSVRVVPEPTWGSRLKIFALNNSVLYNIARRSLRYNPRTEKLLSKLGLTNPPKIPLDFSSSEANSRRWPYSAQFLVDFAARVRATNRKFLVVLIPGKEQVVKEYSDTLLQYTGTSPDDVAFLGFRDFVLRELTDKGVDVLDLTPAFDEPAAGTSADLYFRGDGHWNEAGHELAARNIAEHLVAAHSKPGETGVVSHR